MVGNAWTYMPIDNFGAVFYWWTHALISDQTFMNIKQTCNFSDIGPLFAEPQLFKSDSSHQVDVTVASSSPELCDQYLEDANSEMGFINIYDIYVDMCLDNNGSRRSSGKRPNGYIQQMAKFGGSIQKMSAKHNAGSVYPPYFPCGEDYLTTYLNREDVQTAIHSDIPYAWAACSSLVNYNYSDIEKSVMPLYPEFFAAGLKVLVYSGDVDAIVPFAGTRAWIAALQLPIVQQWRPWMDDGQQVGGYITVYKGMSFATVRNAGHMVPSFQPLRAFDMFSRFLYGKPL